MRPYFIFIIFILSILSCKKDPLITEADNGALNDTVFFYNTGANYLLDLTNDGNSDVRFEFNHDVSPGGFSMLYFKAIIINPSIKTVVRTEIDTICKDTSIINGYERYTFANCHTSTNIFSIDTTTFIPWFDLEELPSLSYLYNSKDTVLIASQDNSTQPPFSPGSIARHIYKGALKNKSEGYMVFVDNKNNKKSLHIKLNVSYLVILKLSNIN